MSEREVQFPATRERAVQTGIALADPGPNPLVGSVFDGTTYLAGLWQNLAREVPPPAPPRPAQQTPRERVRYGHD